MWKMLGAAGVTATLVVLLAPAQVDGYGAAHFGYTHVGPDGVYHAGGAGWGGRTGYSYGPAWRGGGYESGIAAGEAGIARTHWAAATHDYTYVPSYWGPYPPGPYPPGPYPPGPYPPGPYPPGPFYLR
jgi:hypothetical protein